MLLITLRDPPEPEPTWSPDDIAALERAIRDKALELRITWPWLIHIQPETPEIEGSEEEEDEE